MSRASALAILLLFNSAALAAESPTETARQEAVQFLGHCPDEASKERQLCLANQAAFVWDYVSAMSGDITDQKNTAFGFDKGDRALGGGGLLQNGLQACAWRLVIAVSGDPSVWLGDKDLAQSICAKLNPDERSLAVTRADRIRRDIRARRVRKLPGDSTDFYDMAMKGQLTENTFPLGEQRPTQRRKP